MEDIAEEPGPYPPVSGYFSELPRRTIRSSANRFQNVDPDRGRTAILASLEHPLISLSIQAYSQSQKQINAQRMLKSLVERAKLYNHYYDDEELIVAADTDVHDFYNYTHEDPAKSDLRSIDKKFLKKNTAKYYGEWSDALDDELTRVVAEGIDEAIPEDVLNLDSPLDINAMIQRMEHEINSQEECIQSEDGDHILEDLKEFRSAHPFNQSLIDQLFTVRQLQQSQFHVPRLKVDPNEDLNKNYLKLLISHNNTIKALRSKNNEIQAMNQKRNSILSEMIFSLANSHGIREIMHTTSLHHSLSQMKPRQDVLKENFNPEVRRSSEEYGNDKENGDYRKQRAFMDISQTTKPNEEFMEIPEGFKANEEFMEIPEVAKPNEEFMEIPEVTKPHEKFMEIAEAAKPRERFMDTSGKPKQEGRDINKPSVDMRNQHESRDQGNLQKEKNLSELHQPAIPRKGMVEAVLGPALTFPQFGQPKVKSQIKEDQHVTSLGAPLHTMEREAELPSKDMKSNKRLSKGFIYSALSPKAGVSSASLHTMHAPIARKPLVIPEKPRPPIPHTEVPNNKTMGPPIVSNQNAKHDKVSSHKGLDIASKTAVLYDDSDDDGSDIFGTIKSDKILRPQLERKIVLEDDFHVGRTLQLNTGLVPSSNASIIEDDKLLVTPPHNRGKVPKVVKPMPSRNDMRSPDIQISSEALEMLRQSTDRLRTRDAPLGTEGPEGCSRPTSKPLPERPGQSNDTGRQGENSHDERMDMGRIQRRSSPERPRYVPSQPNGSGHYNKHGFLTVHNVAAHTQLSPVKTNLQSLFVKNRLKNDMKLRNIEDRLDEATEFSGSIQSR